MNHPISLHKVAAWKNGTVLYIHTQINVPTYSFLYLYETLRLKKESNASFVEKAARIYTHRLQITELKPKREDGEGAALESNTNYLNEETEVQTRGCHALNHPRSRVPNFQIKN